MKKSDLKTKSISELQDELAALQKEQFNLRMQRGMGQTPKPHQFARARKSVARVKTFINQKQQDDKAVGKIK